MLTHLERLDSSYRINMEVVFSLLFVCVFAGVNVDGI